MDNKKILNENISKRFPLFEVKNFPAWSGVYLFRDANGEVIYVGKAKNIKKRVESYFRKTTHVPRIDTMVSNAMSIEYILTGTEEEALIYEAGLIKKYMPRYNVDLKDDKSYPFLRLSVNEIFPKLTIVRHQKKDGALYFGPYTNSKLLVSALKIMQKIFPLRTCKKLGKKTCIMFDIKQCLGPCQNSSIKNEYKGVVGDLILFLEGKKDLLIRSLSEKMYAYSKNMQYEKAAKIRDQISALTKVSGYYKMDRNSFVFLAGQIKKILKLKSEPSRIEMFDISNISGKWACGSMVCFNNGIPSKDEYRRFKIKLTRGIDDYKMIGEVLKRRYSGSLSLKMKFPDLIIIDGGRGHLNVALEVLLGLGIKIPVMSIAKKEEELFVEWKRTSIKLTKDSHILKFIQRIRDEAHRFAISYHRYLRSKSVRVSELDNIAGINKEMKISLMRKFKDIEGVRNASFDDLMSVKGMRKNTAEKIIGYFRNLKNRLRH